jgi:hypothetical protein
MAKRSVGEGKLDIVSRGIELGLHTAVIGPHGIGKTQAVLSIVRDRMPAFKPVYLSLAQMSKDDLLAPFPVERHGDRWVRYLKHVIFDDLCDDGERRPIVFILDEFNRNISDPQLYNALLEFMSVGTMVGERVNLQCIVALMNPSDDEAYFNTAELELPVLDRFSLFVEVDEYELGADVYLLQHYPEHAPAVIQWYLTLAADKRRLVSPRRQEKVLQAWAAGIAPMYCFPKNTPLPIGQLASALQHGDIWTLDRMASDPARAIRALTDDPTILPLFVAILKTIKCADQGIKAGPLVAALPSHVRTGLLRYKQEVWTPVFSAIAADTVV